MFYFKRQMLIFLMLLFCMDSMHEIVYAETATSIKKTDVFFSCAMISGTRSILVGDRGRILLSDNKGKIWRNINCPTQEPLASVDFVNSDHGWITGQGGVILHSEDGGETWRFQTSPTQKYLFAVDFFDITTGCAVGEDLSVVITDDGGNTWRMCDVRPALPVNKKTSVHKGSFYTVIMLSLREICISGQDGRIFITQDAGDTWQERQSPLYDRHMKNRRMIYGMTHDTGTLYAVGSDNAYIFSKNRGKIWEKGQAGISEYTLYSIAVTGDIGMAVGADGHILLTKDHGETWKKIAVPDIITQATLMDVALTRHDTGEVTGMIAGQNGRVGWYCNGKIGWTGTR